MSNLQTHYFKLDFQKWSKLNVMYPCPLYKEKNMSYVLQTDYGYT